MSEAATAAMAAIVKHEWVDEPYLHVAVLPNRSAY
jgi:hypothetical protein